MVIWKKVYAKFPELPKVPPPFRTILAIGTNFCGSDFGKQRIPNKDIWMCPYQARAVKAASGSATLFVSFPLLRVESSSISANTLASGLCLPWPWHISPIMKAIPKTECCNVGGHSIRRFKAKCKKNKKTRNANRVHTPKRINNKRTLAFYYVKWS